MVTLVALGVSCGGGSGGADGEGAAESTTTTGASPSPSTTTTAPAAPTRIEQVLAGLFALRNQIFSSPDPARVGEYALSDCLCHEEDRNDLVGLVERGEYWDTPQLELRGARVKERPGADEAVLEAVAGRAPERIKNRTGALVGGQGEGVRNFPIRVVLRRRDGAWRFGEVTVIELPPETVSAIAGAGVPSGPPDDASRL